MMGEHCWYEIGTDVFLPSSGPLFSGVGWKVSPIHHRGDGEAAGECDGL